jgi:hypothetical protein
MPAADLKSRHGWPRDGKRLSWYKNGTQTTFILNQINCNLCKKTAIGYLFH